MILVPNVLRDALTIMFVPRWQKSQQNIIITPDVIYAKHMRYKSLDLSIIVQLVRLIVVKIVLNDRSFQPYLLDQGEMVYLRILLIKILQIKKLYVNHL